MSTRKVLTRLMACAVAALLVAAACAPAAPAPTTAPAKPTAAPAAAPTAAPAATKAPEAAKAPEPTKPAAGAAGPIYIGVAGPLTGDMAKHGNGWLNAIKLAASEWNAKGGVLGRQIELIPEDDSCEPKQAAAVANKLSDNDSIVAVIGHFCSGSTLAAGPMYAKKGIPELPLSVAVEITQQGWKNLFRPVSTAIGQADVITDYLMKEQKLTRWALLNDQEAYGVGLCDQVSKAVKAKGGTVTSTGGIDPKGFDFSPDLTRIRSEKAEVVFFGANSPTAAGYLIKQARQLGLDSVFANADSMYDPSYIEMAGSASEGSYVVFGAPPYDSTPELSAFSRKFKEKYGNEPSGFDAYGYDYMNIVAAAIQSAGEASRPAIVKALATSKTPGLIVPYYEFDEKGDLKSLALFVYKVEGGKFKLVYKPK